MRQVAPNTGGWKPVNDSRSRKGALPQATAAAAAEEMVEEKHESRSDDVVSSARVLIDETDAVAVAGAIERYADFSRNTLANDKLATEQGKPLQVLFGEFLKRTACASSLHGCISMRHVQS